MNFPVVDVVAKRFAPQGATVIALLAESHASVHTYPEHGSLFADVFTAHKWAANMVVRAIDRRLDSAERDVREAGRPRCRRPCGRP